MPVLAGSTRDEHRLFVGLFRVLAGQPVTAGQAVPYVQSLAPGGEGVRPVDYAAEHHLDFWEAAGPLPALG